MQKKSGWLCACVLAVLTVAGAGQAVAGGMALKSPEAPFSRLEAALGWKSLNDMASVLNDIEPSEGKADADMRLAMLPDPVAAPAWIANAVVTTPVKDAPMIAVVIDDMGLDVRRSDEASALPAPVTLAWLPYARKLGEQTQKARANGHELLVHMPMEPEEAGENPGPDALLTGLSPAEIQRRTRKNLAAFDGFVGINNHMGSKFTQDTGLLGVVMGELKKRSLMFLDSRTAPATQAETVAENTGIPATHRDVFLDNTATAEAVDAQLAQLEAVARRKGMAVAIGHPHDATIAALARWIPEVKSRGFQIVPITTIVRYQDKRFDIAGLQGNAPIR